MGHYNSVQTTIGVYDSIATGNIDRMGITSGTEDDKRELSTVLDSQGRAVSVGM